MLPPSKHSLFNIALRLRPIKMIGNNDTEVFRKLRSTVVLRHPFCTSACSKDQGGDAYKKIQSSPL